jgi:hypothetical protein
MRTGSRRRRSLARSHEVDATAPWRWPAADGKPARVPGDYPDGSTADRCSRAGPTSTGDERGRGTLGKPVIPRHENLHLAPEGQRHQAQGDAPLVTIGASDPQADVHGVVVDDVLSHPEHPVER